MFWALGIVTPRKGRAFNPPSESPHGLHGEAETCAIRSCSPKTGNRVRPTEGLIPTLDSPATTEAIPRQAQIM